MHVIVNEGREAGASLPHTHAQLYALPFVPAAIARERERFTAYSDRTQGRNLLADLLQEEVKRGERSWPSTTRRWPSARSPRACRSTSRSCRAGRRARFHEDGPLGRGSCCTRRCARLGSVLGALPPLNLWVRTAPRDAERFCWRIDVMPRLAQLAGPRARRRACT